MDYQTKKEIKKEVEKTFSQYSASKEAKKQIETAIQQIAEKMQDNGMYQANIVKQALMAKATLDSDKATKADLQDELLMLINVCMAAPGVIINYYTPEQEG